MVLSGTGKEGVGWRKWLISGWAFLECLLFSGMFFGWGSLVFVLKDEGIYAYLCQMDLPVSNTSNTSSVKHSDLGRNGTTRRSLSLNGSATNNNSITKQKDFTAGETRLCGLQEEKLALCFTIASVLVLVSSALLGHINYKYGTWISRLYGL